MATDGLDYDLRLRLAAFGWLSEQQARGVSEFDRVMLCHGFEFEGERVRYLEALDVYEVSPVMLGAGIGPRTTGIKGAAGGGDGEDADAGDDADGSEGEAGDGNPSGREAELVRIGFDLDLMAVDE